MPQVSTKIVAYGKRKYGTEDMEKILKKMQSEGVTDQKMAKTFGGTVPAIRHWKKKLGLLEPRPRFPEWIRQQGYKGLQDFFKSPKNVGKTFKELARETGYCYVTISNWYHIFEKESGFERG